ncbi:MAG: aminopeptidase, partial [Brevinema sp.]
MKYERPNIWKNIEEATKKQIFETAESYKLFLDQVRTERQGVEWIKKHAMSHGFCDINSKKSLKSGDKVYYLYENKNIALSI